MEYEILLVAGTALVAAIAMAVVIRRFSRQMARERLAHEFELKAVKQQHTKNINTQRAVVKGKIYEQMAPHMPEFTYMPSDARFLGSPIDYVIFDGMSKDDKITIVLVDIKTGHARLNSNQQRIKDAVESGRVEFEMITTGGKSV